MAVTEIFPQSSSSQSFSSEQAVLRELTKPVVWASDRTLPVVPAVKNLFPDGGLRRGSTVVVAGSTSLALAMMAAASAEGSWCAAVGLPSLGLVAAAEYGVELARLALVPNPGAQWATVVGALIDALDVVLFRPTNADAIRSVDARRLVARARERGAVLVPIVDDPSMWPQADLRLRCVGAEWQGLGQGHGYLRKQRLRVLAEGRGAASRSRQAIVSLAS